MNLCKLVRNTKEQNSKRGEETLQGRSVGLLCVVCGMWSARSWDVSVVGVGAWNGAGRILRIEVVAGRGREGRMKE